MHKFQWVNERERKRFKLAKERTLVIDFGLIDSHTRPVKISVTANPNVKRSALDCELNRVHKSVD